MTCHYIQISLSASMQVILTFFSRFLLLRHIAWGHPMIIKTASSSVTLHVFMRKSSVGAIWGSGSNSSKEVMFRVMWLTCTEGWGVVDQHRGLGCSPMKGQRIMRCMSAVTTIIL